MPVERISRGFKDISMSFQANPLNDDLIGLKNENAIARSVKNIVFTLPGEKYFSSGWWMVQPGPRNPPLVNDNPYEAVC